MVRILCFHCRGHRFHPFLGTKISPASVWPKKEKVETPLTSTGRKSKPQCFSSCACSLIMHPHAFLPRKHLGCLLKWPGKATIKEASFFSMKNELSTKQINPMWPFKPMKLLLTSLFLQNPCCIGSFENRDVRLDAFRVPFKPQILLVFYSNSVLTTLNIHDMLVTGVYKLISSQKTESRETVRLLHHSHDGSIRLWVPSFKPIWSYIQRALKTDTYLDLVSDNPLGNFPKEVIQKWRQTFEGKNNRSNFIITGEKRSQYICVAFGKY